MAGDQPQFLGLGKRDALRRIAIAAGMQALQQALTAHGQPVSNDGIYGPFTDQLVRQWQSSRAIVEDGVGPQTRSSLGL